MIEGKPIVFPQDVKDTDRQVSGGLVLEALASDVWSDSPNGFEMANAIVTTRIHKRYLQIDSEVFFDGVTFLAPVELFHASFTRAVNFSSCDFRQELLLAGSEFSLLSFQNTRDERPPTAFRAALTMRASEIQTQLVGGRFIFENPESLLDLNGIKIGEDLLLDGAAIGALNLRGARIGDQFVLRKAQIRSRGTPADLDTIQVGGTAELAGALFAGDCTLQGARINGMLNFTWAEFQGSLDMTGTRVGENLLFDRAKFHGASSEIDLNGVDVRRSISLCGAQSGSKVLMGAAKVAGQVRARDSVFLNKELSLSLNALKAEDVILDDSRFEGPVDLVRLELGDQLSVQQVHCHSDLKCSSAKIRGIAWLYGRFDAAVILARSSFGRDLHLADSKFAALDLSETSVGGALNVFSGDTGERGIVEYSTELPAKVVLTRLTYGTTDLLATDRRWRQWIDTSTPEFDPSAYDALEHAARRTLQLNLADEIYYAHKTAEGIWHRNERRRGAWLANTLLRWTVGYGVEGWRLWRLALYVLVIAAGACYFLKTGDEGLLVTFLHTLDRLAPVPLGAPELEGGIGLAVLNVMTSLAGWLLLPLAIAQLTGVLRRTK